MYKYINRLLNFIKVY